MATKKPEFIESIGPDGQRVLSNILDQFTGDQITYKEVDRHIDGSYMDDDKLDPERILYIKKNGRYFKQNFDLFIPATRIGMVANDDSKGEYNYGRLLYALKIGVPLLIDGVFHISTTSEDNEITLPVQIKGIDRSESKLIFSGGDIISPTNDCEIKDVSIIAQGGSTTFFARYQGVFDASFVFKNCHAEGSLRLLSATIPETHDFTSQFSGFRRVEITLCDFTNIYNISGGRTFIHLTDIPVNKIIIADNEVTNFSYLFLNMGITNGHPSTEFIWRSRVLSIIRRNKVICDKDYDAQAVNGGYSPTYYCFALIEGDEVVCTDNRFEGFHVIDAPNTVVYDNYLSCIKLTYDRNEYVNIVNFTEGNFYRDILKSKMSPVGSTDSDLNIERFYRGNSFKMEPSFADYYSQDRFLLRKTMSGYQNPFEKVVIENNSFDVYILSWDYYGMRHVRNYTLNNNTVNAYTAEQGFNTQSFVWIPGISSGESRQTFYKYSITNNTIKVKNPPLESYKSANTSNSLIRNEASTSDTVDIIFENNNIDMFGLDYIFRDNRSKTEVDSEGSNWGGVSFKRNNIKMLGTGSSSSIIPRTMNTFLPFDSSNKIWFSSETTSGLLYLFYSRLGNNKLPPLNETKFSFTYGQGQQHIRLFNFVDLLDRDVKIMLKVAITTETDSQQFYSEFSVLPGEEYNTIRAIARDYSSGQPDYTQQDYVLDSSGGRYGNFIIQRSDIFGERVTDSDPITLGVNISNTSSIKEANLSIQNHLRTPNVQYDITVSILPL